jgi:Zn-dependent M28 family amino/carboxypeptidase
MIPMGARALALLALWASAAGAAETGTAAGTAAGMPAPVAAVARNLRAAEIAAHTRFLSSDLLEGRGPGTRGDQLAVEYIVTRFQALGLQPAGEDGTYLQKVPLIGVRTDPEKTSLTLTAPSGTLAPRMLEDLVVTNETQAERSAVHSELVFVGHGVVAPEHRWDDYKGQDLRGKTLVMLVDDPPATPEEPKLFGGIARTYYGRWTYKYEEALRQGAAGAILVHTDASAGYGWSVVRNSWGRERPFLKLRAGEPALTIAAWVTQPVAEKLLQLAGKDLATLTASARSRGFKPVPLGVRVSGHIGSTLREMTTYNVLGRLEGSDPRLRDEVVIYSAHHDHLGMGVPRDGDAIYNGAVDNATGVAILIELARAWSSSPQRPRRSLLFFAPAAEEGGLRGSEHYAAHPLVAPGRTAFNLNFDSVHQLGRVRNVSMLGIERTTFDPAARKVAQALSLRVDPDEHPEQGSFYRSDHFSLAKAGIPAVSVKLGMDHVGREPGWGKKQWDEYEAKRYHQPDDEYDPAWDFAEGVQMAELLAWLAWEAAETPSLPNWIPGDELRAARDRSLESLPR